MKVYIVIRVLEDYERHLKKKGTTSRPAIGRRRDITQSCADAWRCAVPSVAGALSCLKSGRATTGNVCWDERREYRLFRIPLPCNSTSSRARLPFSFAFLQGLALNCAFGSFIFFLLFLTPLLFLCPKTFENIV
jgi:hypothetical protein